jgi:uncharacterized SAM-binding protein YcdF (DUF218 family)
MNCTTGISGISRDLRAVIECPVSLTTGQWPVIYFMAFAYSLFLKLLDPTSLSLILLLASAGLWRWKREKLARISFWSALAMLFVCGNGWLVGAMTKHLEWQYLPPNTVPEADAILVLSGGIEGKVPPRPTVEVGDVGDRLLYGAYLFRSGRAPQIICTGGVATGGITRRPAAEDMAEFLELIGIPGSSIVTEVKSENTHEHAKNLYPLLKEKHFKRILLVTSAMHMPRSMGVFKKLCPGMDFIPAPTDFHATVPQPMAWYRHMMALVPTPRSLLNFSEVTHEYVGIAYYRVRGWM